LNEALEILEAKQPRLAEIVLLRYFTGLTIEETASALGLTSRTVSRDWRFARAWLMAHVEERTES
jgi:RNA polymerase sigma factor (sigma-70 family)